MSKYLEDKYLDSVLEAYFNEGIKDIFKKKNKNAKRNIINGINYEIIRKDGKDYRVNLPDEIKKEGEVALKILLSELKKLQSSKEYKAIINDLYSNNKISAKDKNIKLTDDVYKEVYAGFKKYIYNVGIFSKMSQDMFYAETSDKKHIYDLTDKLFKELEKNKTITSLPHYHGIYNGDDFYGIDISFYICDLDNPELVEIK